MTREEATICRIFLEDVAGKYKNCEEYKLLMDAVNAEPCEDAVSREFMYKLGARCIAVRNKNDELIAIAAIEDLPPVYPKPKTGWIPIKTRSLTEKEKAEMGTESDYMYDCPLPDDGEEVEVTTHLGDVAMDIFCRDPEGCYFENYCDDGDVLAWRHKPEPYKAESEDKR